MDSQARPPHDPMGKYFARALSLRPIVQQAKSQRPLMELATFTAAAR